MVFGPDSKDSSMLTRLERDPSLETGCHERRLDDEE